MKLSVSTPADVFTTHVYMPAVARLNKINRRSPVVADLCGLGPVTASPIMNHVTSSGDGVGTPDRNTAWVVAVPPSSSEIMSLPAIILGLPATGDQQSMETRHCTSTLLLSSMMRVLLSFGDGLHVYEPIKEELKLQNVKTQLLEFPDSS